MAIFENRNNEVVKGKNAQFGQYEGKQWPQIMAICVVTLGPLTDGIMLAWSSPFAVVILEDKKHYNLTGDDVSYFFVFQTLGMIFASLFYYKIADILGRKKSVLSLSIPHLVCWILTIFANTKWDFYLARFFAGIGNAVMFCTIPSYVGEICTPKVRGQWGNFPVFILCGGAFFITVLGSYVYVTTAAYICIGIPVVFAFFVCYLPESPYQLIKDGKYKKAKQSIKWLRRKSDIEDEFLKMKSDVERQMSESGTWKDLFTIASNRRALRAGMFLRFSQQFCGILVFVSNAQIIFQKAGTHIGAQFSSMIFSGLIWILNLVCSVSIEKFGRKPSYFYSLIGSGIILLIIAIYFFLEQYHLINLEGVRWFPLAGMIVWVIAYSPGLGIVPTIMLGELFSSSIKSKGLCVLVGTFGIAVFLTSNIFNLLTNYVGLYCPFLVYGISCLISSFLTLRWVPETKGRTLEEIQQVFKNQSSIL